MRGGAVPLARRLVWHDRTRFLITVGGVGFAVVLILFLGAVYQGVRIESNGYVAGRPVSVWVAQDNTTNIIRSSSFLRGWRRDSLARLEGVAHVTPILRLITTAEMPAGHATLFVIGVAPGDTAAAPALVAGRQVRDSGEVVLDQAFARKFHLTPGDTLRLQERPYCVTGLSTGTNAVITQFAFIPLRDAHDMLGFQDVASFFLVTGRPGVSPDTLVARIRGAMRRVNVFTQAQFVDNNLAEMQSGLLPVLATVAIFGGLIGVAVLALLLYGAVIERREDYALLKALGAGRRAVRNLVLRQAIVAVTGGFAIGLAAYAALMPLVLRLVPQLALSLSPAAVALTFGAALLMGLGGALLPIARLHRVYPAEVFRA